LRQPGARVHAAARDVSGPHPRGPRRETVVKRLSDLPTTESPRDERERRIREKRERDKERNHERGRRERFTSTAVTWLDEPVPIKPGSGLMVAGVCSDCDPAVAREYLCRAP
jgi:hypothetical protein